MQTAFKAATLFAVVALAACGGSNSSRSGEGSTTAAQPLSKAVYSVDLQQVGTSLVSALNTFGKKFSSFKRIEMSVGRAWFRPAEELEILTPAQLAGLLQVEEETVIGMAERKEIPARKVGEEWRFSRDAVLAWLAEDE